MYIICEKNFEEQKRFSCGRKKIARLSEIFGLLWDRRERKKHTLFFVSFSRTLSLSGVLSDRLSRRINQISYTYSLARVSRSFIKECLYIRRTLLSLLYYSYQGTEEREREREQKAQTLSLSTRVKKREDRRLNPSSTTAQSRGRVCDHRLSRENISLI